jgi:hypothetical protein
MATDRYVPRGRNELHTIFERHFAEFCEHYEEKYAATYGKYRLDRIQQIGERFCTCGDYLQGVARIRCTNPECGLVGAFGTPPLRRRLSVSQRKPCQNHSFFSYRRAGSLQQPPTARR